jgi:hypothetical protein
MLVNLSYYLKDLDYSLLNSSPEDGNDRTKKTRRLMGIPQ